MNGDSRQFDFRTLQLFRLVAKTGSFTRAGEQLGTTQSAVTRQIQQLEQRVGTALLQRTTRSVHLTDAGESFLEITSGILADFDAGLARFRETFLDQPPVVRVGLSHSIASAHLPGLLSRFRRTSPRARVFVSYESGAAIREQLVDGKLDLGIITEPPKAPAKLIAVHSFRDDFVVITRAGYRPSKSDPAARSWLAMDDSTTTGALLRDWIADLRPGLVPAMELNSFDTIIDLVALGLGSSIVPRRALRLHSRRRQVEERAPKGKLFRQIGVYRRQAAASTPTIEQFVDSILFGWQGPPTESA